MTRPDDHDAELDGLLRDAVDASPRLSREVVERDRGICRVVSSLDGKERRDPWWGISRLHFAALRGSRKELIERANAVLAPKSFLVALAEMEHQALLVDLGRSRVDSRRKVRNTCGRTSSHHCSRTKRPSSRAPLVSPEWST